MQDKDPEPDDDLCVKVNLYLADPSAAASAASSSAGETAADAPAAPTNDNASGAMDQAELLRLMQRDKKVADGRLRFVLPTRLGEVELVADVRDHDVVAALQVS